MYNVMVFPPDYLEPFVHSSWLDKSKAEDAADALDEIYPDGDVRVWIEPSHKSIAKLEQS